jgi:hypothetical protein
VHFIIEAMDSRGGKAIAAGIPEDGQARGKSTVNNSSLAFS